MMKSWQVLLDGWPSFLRCVHPVSLQESVTKVRLSSDLQLCCDLVEVGGLDWAAPPLSSEVGSRHTPSVYLDPSIGAGMMLMIYGVPLSTMVPRIQLSARVQGAGRQRAGSFD